MNQTPTPSAAEKDGSRFSAFETDLAAWMQDPEFAAAYRAAEEREARLIEGRCPEGNCLVRTDPQNPAYESGWGPVGCPCQDTDTRTVPAGDGGRDA